MRQGKSHIFDLTYVLDAEYAWMYAPSKQYRRSREALMKPKYSFFGFPRTSPKNTTEKTIAIVGSISTSKSIHPTYGQEKATSILRKLSREYDTHNMYCEVILDDFDIVDLGDFGGSDLSSAVKMVLDRGGRVIVVGGDHTTTYYSLKEIVLPQISILDAHLDSEDYTEAFHHGCVVRRIIEEKKDVHVKIVGFRGFSTICSEYEYLQKHNAEIIPWPVENTMLSEIIAQSMFTSIDLDFFDPTSFPAVRVPEVFGADFSGFVHLIHGIKKTKLRYIDIVEYAPSIDIGYVCGKKLIQLLLELLALFARSV